MSMLYLPCPKCDGELQVKLAKQGPKAGLEFYGCDNFPLCKFTAEKTNIIDLVKSEVFKKEIPTQDSKHWSKEYLTKLTKIEIKFLASINDVSFTSLDEIDVIIDRLLFLNNFDLFELPNRKWCFTYKIQSDFFSGLKFLHNHESNLLTSTEKTFEVVDNYGYVGGIFKITSFSVFLEFMQNYQIKYESENLFILILDLDRKTALAQVANPQVINNKNFSNFLLTVEN